MTNFAAGTRRINFGARFGALTAGAFACFGCIVAPAADENAVEQTGQAQERLFDKYPSPLAGDQTVRVQRLAYRCGFLNLSICDNTTDDFGVGVEKLRAIPGSDKEDIFVAFPNGHPKDPSTVIVLSAGMQDVLGSGILDSITGQEDGWRFTEKSRDRKLLGDSLLGRLKADPRVSSWGNAYIVVVLDNAAGWSDPNSREIHEAFARFAYAKVGANTKRVVLGGYSRGGIMVAEMARHLRMTTGSTLRNDTALFVGTFDAVAGGGGKFGVNNTSTIDNPLIDNSTHADFMKEVSAVETQIAASKRQNLTFFYNDVSGGRVVSPALTIHAFGSKNYDIIPNYWTERWETIAHTDYKAISNRAQIFDPFLDWLNEIDLRARPGLYTTLHNDVWVDSSSERVLYLSAKAGSNFVYRTDWDNGLYSADLDLEVSEVAGLPGNVVARGTSTSSWMEEVNFTAPRTGTYRVRVFAKSGGAMTRVLHTVRYDVTQVGYIYLPNELVDSHHDYTRTYRLPALTAGGAINLELTWNNRNLDVDLWLYNKNGTAVATSRSVNNAERISYLVPPAEGPYTVVVESYSHLDAQFELRGTAPLLP